jgi:hypothetical protein
MFDFIHSMRKILLVVAGITPIASGIAVLGQAPTAIEKFQSLQEALRRSHAAGDAAAYLDGAHRLHDFLNGSPNSVLQLMSAEAFAGKQKDALQSLAEFVRMASRTKMLSRQSNSTRCEATRSMLRFTMRWLRILRVCPLP